MSSRYKVMCGCECCISAKSMHSSLLSWRDSYLKKLKDLSQNAQNRRSGEKANRIYKTYKIQSCHMSVIFKPKNMIWQSQKFMQPHSLIMRYHTGNVYWDVVPNVLESTLLNRKQMIIILTPFLQFILIFIIWLHVIQNMSSFR